MSRVRVKASAYKGPTYDQLMNPVLKALTDLGGSATNEEISEKVSEQLRLPPDLVNFPHANRPDLTELQYRLMWARTYLKKVGLIDNSRRGIWRLTERGENTPVVEPTEVVRQVRIQLGTQQASDPPRSGEADSDLSSPESASANDPNLTGPDELLSWRKTLLEALLTISPAAFERLAQLILRESGFTQVEVTGRTGDGGIDGKGILRLNGLVSFHVMFQCKRHRNSVGARDIRDFRGAMAGRSDKGLFITTSTFTREARHEATRDGVTPIDLVDGEELMSRLKELQLGVTTRQVEVVEVDTSWFRRV